MSGFLILVPRVSYKALVTAQTENQLANLKGCKRHAYGEGFDEGAPKSMKHI